MITSLLGLVAALSASSIDAPAASAVGTDTTTPIRFNIPEQALPNALREFSRQAGVRVQVDVEGAASLRSTGVTGVLTVPQALRALLGGTAMTPRFADMETVRVVRDQMAPVALTRLTVLGVRSRGYAAARTSTATRTDTPLRDAPQAVTVLTRDAMADQAMQSMADVVRYVPGVTMGQGEGHRDAPTIRGNSSTADFFVDGVRDDAQYFRDLYNVERVEALKGSNAMIFGRGGGGGVLNRVTKEAQWAPVHSFTLEGGSFAHRRGTLDLGQGVGSRFALRFNGLYESSGGFRDQAGLDRVAVNPTLAFVLGANTTLRGGYEYFKDDRVVDRGIPSFQGRPSDAPIHTYFGNPDSSYATAAVHAASAVLEHAAGPLNIRSHLRFTGYDKFYQNSFPGAVNADGTQVNLSAYANQTDRQNLFNQTDVTYEAITGAVQHTLLLGTEIGRQESDNFRETGYYNDATTSFAVPFEAPNVSAPITFRQSATDADNRTVATVAAIYAQNQVTFSRHWQAVAGLRFDRFALDFHNNRTDEDLSRTDELLSPRAGLIFKPVEAASIYGSYSVSYLPSSGDQFGSLTATTETLKPEQFRNYELGAKWDVAPTFSLSAAVYRLDRSNTTAPDPNEAGRVVQTGSQRTRGVELNAMGNVTPRWQVVAAAALQEAEITSTTTAAPAGRELALVPEQSFSLWNRYQLHSSVGVGLGVIHRSEMWAAIDNAVTLPGFTRADAALYLGLVRGLSAQVNVENLFDERYYNTSHGNNNIMPGASRTLRVSLTTRR